ncbi:MAG: electron transport complex subunit E [Deltaproteobacteria bacterium]|nr:electron transport complex subunit E [Deltaproteobacteria bacterium]MBN2670105.1 electron transport complex subunit E [Deltaproteobacteria bacterium]
MKTLRQEFTKGFTEQLPPFKLVLGLCPTLAVTTSLEGGLGMGLATLFVLIMSNLVISALRNLIPKKVRIAAFITVIAGFVVIVELLMKAYTPQLFDILGVFISLIVVNCIVLGRAEAFAKKNNAVRSILDGAGIGLGFTLSLGVLGFIREVLGRGSVTLFSQANLKFQLLPVTDGYFFKLAVEPPGAFLFLGLILFFINLASMRQEGKKTSYS